MPYSSVDKYQRSEARSLTNLGLEIEKTEAADLFEKLVSIKLCGAKPLEYRILQFITYLSTLSQLRT